MLLYIASLSLSYPSIPHFLSHFSNLSHLLIDLSRQTALLLQRHTRFHGSSAITVVLCLIVVSPFSAEEKKKPHTQTQTQNYD